MYQPLNGLDQPVVVDPSRPNLEGVRITVVCNPTDYLRPPEARSLCVHVRKLLQRQGAVVSTRTGAARAEGLEVGQDGDAGAEGPSTDLTVELTARELSSSRHPLTWGLFAITFSLVPAVSESTFAQDIVVRDAAGAPLASETVTGRLSLTVGSVSWAGNKLLDWLAREEGEKVTGDASNVQLSQDLDRQISQTLFNARLQLDVSRAARAVSEPAP